MNKSLLSVKILAVVVLSAVRLSAQVNTQPADHLFIYPWLNDIYVLTGLNSQPEKLTTNASVSEVILSPDGKHIAYVAFVDGNFEIFTMNWDASENIRLTNNEASDFQISWSPNGKKLAFVSDRDGDWEVYRMNIDGSNPMNVSNHSGWDAEPSWSADSQHLTLISDRADPKGDIYSVNQDGSNLTRLTQNKLIEKLPEWSPDGSKIAFARYIDYCSAIFVMDADGSDELQIGDPICDLDQIKWTADGEILYLKGSTIYTVMLDGSGQAFTTLPDFGETIIQFDYLENIQLPDDEQGF